MARSLLKIDIYKIERVKNVYIFCRQNFFAKWFYILAGYTLVDTIIFNYIFGPYISRSLGRNQDPVYRPRSSENL